MDKVINKLFNKFFKNLLNINNAQIFNSNNNIFIYMHF